MPLFSGVAYDADASEPLGLVGRRRLIETEHVLRCATPRWRGCAKAAGTRQRALLGLCVYVVRAGLGLFSR